MRRLLALGVLGLGLMTTTAGADARHPPAPSQETMRAPAVELRVAMHRLWEDHITYTRNFIISALAGLPDQDAVTKRLLANQDDIGNAIKPYYGEDAGKKLTALLREHILIAADVVKEAKAGDPKRLAMQQQRWTANGKDIAAFLSAANPSWAKKDLEAMLQKHLDLTTGEVVARLTKDWAKDVASYDEGHTHMLMFADTLAEGIVKQFPAKFRRTEESKPQTTALGRR